MSIEQKNEQEVKNEELVNKWREKSNSLGIKCEELKVQLMDREKTLEKVTQTKDTLIPMIKKVQNENAKLKRAQSFFMDWAREQEWELPPHIRDLLPKDPIFMRKAAFERVPRGRSPAEYTFNLLYFLSLPVNEQVELGSKVFHREKMIRPEDSAGLQMVTHELHDFLFHFPDEDVKMTAEYGFQATCVPKYSQDPQSEWVIQKNLAVKLFDVYTRVIVKSQQNRCYTYLNVATSRKEKSLRLSLFAERIITYGYERGHTKLYKIKAKCDSKTGKFDLMNDGVHYWEIVNYGMVNYRGHYKVSNLVMDNNPPYREGMKGMVQILWTGTCVYDSAED